jgi:diguanylate cyclase (GGDEF)-like protein
MPYGNALRPEVEGPALTNLKLQLRERLWSSVLVMALVLTPLSLVRAFETGWLPVYTVHCAVLASLLAVQALTRWIPPRLRVAIAVAYIEYTAVVSLYRMGFVGLGSLWLAMGSYIIGVIYGMRAAAWSVVAHVAFAAFAWTLYRNGTLFLPMNADSYMRMVTPWMLFAGMLVGFPWMLLRSIGLYKQSVVQLAQESERQRVEIERMALHDPLTGLLQLRVVQDSMDLAIQRAAATGRKVAVLFIDLDGFKQVNDRYGHAAGDHLLCEIGKALPALVREGDTVGRLGGDEFLVVLDNLASPEAAENSARRIVNELHRPIAFHDALLHVGASVGIAMYPEDGATAAALQQAADSAMYSVKRSGKGGYAFCNGEPVHIALQPATPETTRNLRVLQSIAAA